MKDPQIASMLNQRTLFYAFIVAAFGLAAALFSPTSSAADPLENRYPYDPACAWGRVADGRGMLVRCISRAEASQLLSTASKAKKTTSKETEPAEPPGDDAEEKAPEDAGQVTVRLIRVKADKGELSLAMKKLGAPKDRYLTCLEQNGGLSGNTGEIHVRFLVRSRGRAEGVSVSKRSNVSPEAARCVADVVDRRLVGTPAEPIVGATAVFEFQRQE